MRVSVMLIVFMFIIRDLALSQIQEGESVLTDPRPLLDANEFYHVSNDKFKCFRQLAACSNHGWSVRLKLSLNQFHIREHEYKHLLFSTGAHEAHSDGVLVYLHQLRNVAFIEFGLKEFLSDQFACYWNVEVDLELNRWIDVVITVGKDQSSHSRHHQMKVYFDGYLYKATEIDNYKELPIFKYDGIHSASTIIYGNYSGLAMIDDILYYERVLTDEEIAKVSLDVISLGCAENDDHIRQYAVPGSYDRWALCRDECHSRKNKIALFSPANSLCGCVQTSVELDASFNYDSQCTCTLDEECSSTEQWHVLAASRVIDVIDAEVGLEIHMADARLLVDGRTRVERNEGVEMIVTVKNERNLAALTVYGDIEDHDSTNANSTSNDIHITPGTISLSWRNEGPKKVTFRADYRRTVNGETSETNVIDIDVFRVKTDQPLNFIHLSSDNYDGNTYQNFTVQAYGTLPINCTIDFGDEDTNSDASNRYQCYTTQFSKTYTRYGQYNVSLQCYNELSVNKTQITRIVRRRNMNKKMIITKNLIETSTAARFDLMSRDDYVFRHPNCLYLKNRITNDRIKTTWKKTVLETITNKPMVTGKYLYQLECDSIPLQPYIINVQPAIASLDIEPSKSTIKSGQSVDFFITLRPTLDFTIVFDCGSTPSSYKIIYVQKTIDQTPIHIANCTYLYIGQYYASVRVMNRVSSANRSVGINVELPLSPFEVEAESNLDINRSTLITIQALEPIPFEGIFTLTVYYNDSHEENMTKTEFVDLLPSNNFRKQIYANITTYGRQILHVRGEDLPTIREAQTTFTIGTELITKPQAYIVNQIGVVNEDTIWIDFQWVDGIGFDIQINYGDKNKVIIRYGHFISIPANRTIKRNYGIQTVHLKRLAKHHLKIGYKFAKPDTYEIGIKIIQPSLKVLTIPLKCARVTIIEKRVLPKESCFQGQNLHLESSASIFDAGTPGFSVLHLPYSLQHDLEPIITTECSRDDFIYCYYLLAINSSHWKYSRTQQYPTIANLSFPETFIESHCSNFQSKPTITIAPKTLPLGYYLFAYTISKGLFWHDFQEFFQPVEIVRSDLITTFGGNITIMNINEKLHLDFYLTTADPDGKESDRQKLNFTLICYADGTQSTIFVPNSIQLGPSRPSDVNPHNINDWSITWSELNVVLSQPELHIQFIEKKCFSPNTKKDTNRTLFQFDSDRKILTLEDNNLMLHNSTLHFLLIVRHETDHRQLITRLNVDKQLNLVFDNADLNALENIVDSLDDLASTNPSQAVEFIGGLADRLNQMSDNTTTKDTNEAEIKARNDRMATMRSKMLSSMNTVLDAASDPNSVDKALKASTTVTANSDQMPLNNQEKGANIIEKVGTKVKDMESADDETVTNLAASLINVGGNILQAASKTVTKDKYNDPDAVVETLESDVKATENVATDTKVLYAPTQFYEACDECETLPEERWEEFRLKMVDEKKNIIEGRERASNIAKRSSTGLFTVGDALMNRSSTNETKTIEGKTMTMTFSKANPDGMSSLSAGDTNIRLPLLSDLNFDSDSDDVVTKILESKENPFASKHGNSGVQGSVVTIVLSRSNGSDMPIKNTTKPISIRLSRPADKQPKAQQHELHDRSFRYHKVNLPDKEMALSVSLFPNESTNDTYAVYVSFGTNETALEPPTESKFDLLFVVPNRTSLESTFDTNSDDEYELKHTIFMPPGIHLGNGTYIFGVKLIYANTTTNISDYRSSYTLNMYVSKCQYWDENNFVWSSDGCEVGPSTTLKSTECLCTHLTTFGGDFYIPVNKIDFSTVFTKFKTLHENAVVFSTVIAIICVYILAAIWARYKDKRDLIKAPDLPCAPDHWTATPLLDNLHIDIYHYLITVHTGLGKESGTESNIRFIISGESDDSGVRKLTDGKIKGFPAGSVRNFVMSVESPLGPLLYLRVWHDNSGPGKKASWFLNMINVMDLQTGEKSYFLCNNWLAVEKGDGLVDRIIPVASQKELKSFSHLFTESVKKKLSDGHLWFSVFSRPVRSNFTRLQRISCCMSLLFCTMISNAMFYRQDTQASANQAGVLLEIGPIQFTMTQLIISFLGTMVVLPVNLIIIALFRKAKYSQKTLIKYQKPKKSRKRLPENDEQYKKTRRFFSRCKPRSKHMYQGDDEVERIGVIPSVEDKTRTLPHWTVYVAWALVVLSILTSSFFIILYSLEWGAQRANEWLMTMMLSFGQSVLVIDPLKVFIITAIISFLLRRPYDDETLDLEDPFTETLIANNSLPSSYDHDGTYDEKDFRNIALQRRIRVNDLSPIDPNVIARARERRLKEIKMGEIIREIITFALFTVVLLFLSYQARDTNSHGLYRDTKNLFINKDFHDVNSVSTWWSYCDSTLLKGLYAQAWYNNKSLTWREKLTVASRMSMRVGAPRIRQLRVKDNSCRIHPQFRHVISHCRNDYNWFDDDTKDYTPRWGKLLNRTATKTNDETHNQTTRCKTPWCYQTSLQTKSDHLTALYRTYKGGGYVASLGRTYQQAQTLLNDLRAQNWLDQLTRAVIVDFSLYNANINLFVSVTLSFEMTSMGSVIQDHRIKVFRLYDHVGSYGIVVYTFELLFVVFTIYSVQHEISLIRKYRREYFSKFWNKISFVTTTFSVAAILMYGTKKTLTRLAIRALKKTEMGEFINFNTIGSFDEVYSYIVALITFFTMLKFLKLLRFNRRIGMLSKTFAFAARDLNSFGFVFIIFILAYAQMGFALFGRSLSTYRTVFISLTTCFRMLLGEINAPAMVSVSPVYGVFFYLSFVSIVFIALLSIFIAILNDSFARVKRDLIATRHKNEMVMFMWSTLQNIAGVNNRNRTCDSMGTANEHLVENDRMAPLAQLDIDKL